MKIRQLLNIKECEFKAYMDSFNFYTREKKNIMISNTYKNIIKNYILSDYSDSELIELINRELEDSYFITKHEKQAVVNNIFTNLNRYGRKVDNYIVDKDIKDDVNVRGNNIEVKADVVYKIDDNTYEIAKIRTSKPSLSYKARNRDNLPENDVELYCMYLLGKQLYPDKNIVSSCHHMSGKKDSDKEGKDYYKELLKGNEYKLCEQALKLEEQMSYCTDKKEITKIKKSIKTIQEVLNYDFTEGNNVISCSSFNENYITDNIQKLMNIKLNENSNKCCDDSKCNMCDYSVYCKNKPIIKLEELKQLESIQKEVILTEEQREVYLFNEGICKVLAGAGSGKSTTMAMRILRLIKEGCNPQDILLITFTEKGAKELKDKIIKLSKFYKVYFDYNDLEVFTFNSFGQYLINLEYKMLGYDKCPELATNINTLDILKELVEKYENIEWLNYKNPLMSMKNYKGALIQLKEIFSRIKSFDYSDIELLQYLKDSNLYNIKDYSKAIEDINTLYDEFNNKLKENNLIEYQDQILLTTKILQNKLQGYGYKHIVVDEYQDTDKAQVKILKLLVDYNWFESLMVVGDINQSIFGFRNTTPDNIINFEKEFNNVEVKYMVNNFRSTKEIVDLANKFISQNESCGDMKSKAFKQNGNLVQLKEFDTLKEEKEYHLKLIKDKINDDEKLTDICYIGRTRKELEELKELLESNNIPCNLKVTERYIDNNIVKSILNLAYYFKDTTKNYYLWEFMNVNGVKESETIKQYDDLINNRINDNDNVLELFFNIIDELIKDEIAIKFINNIKTQNYHSISELLTYLNKVSLYNDDTSIEKDDKLYNAITLTTGHGSKGLEWKIVISSLNNFKYENIEEDRRLLYVVLTRAKDELYLTYNNNMDKSRYKGKHTECVDEIIECLNE